LFFPIFFSSFIVGNKFKNETGKMTANFDVLLAKNKNRTGDKKGFSISILDRNNSYLLKYRFTKTSTVSDLFQAYADEVDPTRVVKMYRGNTPIPREQGSKQLKDFGFIRNGSKYEVTAVVSLVGGAQVNNSSFSLDRMRYLPDDDDDIILSNNECVFYSIKPCAQMQCGCAVSAKGMYGWIHKSFELYPDCYQITCPFHPDTEWNWDVCTVIADMNDQEFEYFDKERNKRSSPEVKACPHCQAMCERPSDLKLFRVRCNSCKGSDWCFKCGKPWNSSITFTFCGNSGCVSTLINEALRTCPMKKTPYNNVEVPSIRACPKCYEFIAHEDKCKHMKCPKCKVEFCFSCLALKSGSWPCNSHTYQCAVAPRQVLK
jgi:hypothetical protein